MCDCETPKPIASQLYQDRLLRHGDITKFNCKRLHAVSKADRDRVVIVVWQRNPKWVEKNYKQGSLF